jgi:hypothetical protein
MSLSARCRGLVCIGVLLLGGLCARAQSDKTMGGLIYSSFPGEPAPSRELLETLMKQARWDTSRTGDQNPDGLRLRFEKVGGQEAQGMMPPRYRVFAEGAPENKVYGLTLWRVGEDFASDPRDIYVNSQGLVLLHKPDPRMDAALQAPGDELELTPEAATAEPVRYMLWSKDDQLEIFGTLVPSPLVTQDQTCTLEMRIAEPHASAVLIVAGGFPADARIPLILESAGQTTHMTMATNSSGNAEVADFPFAPGKMRGTLKATAEGPSCLPSVVLAWEAQPDQKGPVAALPR